MMYDYKKIESIKNRLEKGKGENLVITLVDDKVTLRWNDKENAWKVKHSYIGYCTYDDVEDIIDEFGNDIVSIDFVEVEKKCQERISNLKAGDKVEIDCQVMEVKQIAFNKYKDKFQILFTNGVSTYCKGSVLVNLA